MADTPQEEPQRGGSYVRNPDGTLTPAGDAQTSAAPPSDEPAPGDG